MKYLIAIFFFLSVKAFCQRSIPTLNLDSLNLIQIIDHQNINFEWYYGRVFYIRKIGDEYRMFLVDQYNRPYFFGEPEKNISTGSIDSVNLKVMDGLGIAIDRDSAMGLANLVASRRHRYLADKIKLRNSSDTISLGMANKDQIVGLLKAVNDRDSRHPLRILENLNMDSAWVAKNAERLFDAYGLRDAVPTPKQREYCLSCFRDWDKARRAAFALIGRRNSSDYPYIEVSFFQGGDTLKISTDNPFPLSMPWLYQDSLKSFNPAISLRLADLLPFYDYSNKSRLCGDYGTISGNRSIEESFARSVVHLYCSKFKNENRRKRKRIYLESAD